MTGNTKYKSRISNTKKYNAKNKKGSSLSLETVIIAAIVILVLVVVIMVFVKGVGRNNKAINQTQGVVDACIPGNDANCELFKDNKMMVPMGTGIGFWIPSIGKFIRKKQKLA